MHQNVIPLLTTLVVAVVVITLIYHFVVFVPLTNNIDKLKKKITTNIITTSLRPTLLTNQTLSATMAQIKSQPQPQSQSQPQPTTISPITPAPTYIPTSPSYSFTSHTFTNAGATGRIGPTLSQVKNAYSSASWAQNNNFLNMINDNGIQLWTVPTTGNYTIQAIGAAGGNSGRGRNVIINNVLLTKSEVIKILVGQKGTYVQGPDGVFRGGGGGGGTFVVRGTQTAIIVAGGGGGYGEGGSNPSTIASDASASNNGNNGGTDSGGQGGTAQGGSAGSGGEKGGYSSGGGGLLSDGGSDNATYPDNRVWALGGKAFINGGVGGDRSNDNNFVGIGGFGGGGSGGAGGSGGGGYSGGGGGNQTYYFWTTGGGGGSYGITTFTDNGATNTGHGSVTITLQ